MNKNVKIGMVVAAVLVVLTVFVDRVISYFDALPIHKSRMAKTPPGQEIQIGGPFTLVDHTGKTVTEADYRGRYMLTYFGYTYCPDVCPTSLQTMMTAWKTLTPEQQARVVPLFVTVDPERDTVAQMKSYVSAFGSGLVGLTGTPEQTAAAAKAYKAYFAKVVQKDDQPYLVDHSSITYLMDRDGRYHAHFGHNTPSEAIAEKLKALP